MIKRRNLFSCAAARAIALTGAPAFADPAAALAALQETVLSKGPNGETPAAASSISLSEEELRKIRSMNATAAIVMHYGGNDWSQAQISGLSTQFENGYKSNCCD